MQDDFEKKLKEEFDKLEKDYDGINQFLESQVQMKPSVVDKLNDKAWNLYLTDTHICDCERNHGGECKYPNKQEGGCR